MSEPSHGAMEAAPRRPLLHLAARIFGTPLAIEQKKYEAIVQLLGDRIWSEDLLREELPSATHPAPLEEARSPDGIPAGSLDGKGGYCLTSDGICILPICGTLVEKSSWMDASSGLTSYKAIAARLKTALAEPQCRAILLDIDSPGGETHGMFDLADLIYQSRSSKGGKGTKPIYAVADNSALSAAYALASAADRIFVTRTGAVGSIGVFATHIDQSKADEKAGLKYTYVYFGNKKTEGNPHEPLSKDAYASAEKEVNREGAMFVETVARNRGISKESVIDTEAGLYFAGEGILVGLADEVGSREDAYLALAKKSGILIPSSTPFSSRNADAQERDVPVIGYKKTATVRKTWSASSARANLKEGESQGYYSEAHAYRDAQLDPKTKNAYTFIHHEVSSSGEIGAANLTACSSAIAVLNGGRGGQGRATYTPAERRGIYNHVAHHQRDAGEEPSPLKSYLDYVTERLAEGHISPADSQALHDEVMAVLQTDPLLLGAADGPDSEGEKNPMAKALTPAEEQDLVNKLAAQAASPAAAKPRDDEDSDDKPGAKKQEPDEEDEDEPDDEEEEDDEKKKSNTPTMRKTRKAAANLDDAAVRANHDAKEIAELCTLAGYPGLVAGFLRKDMTVAEVRAKLLDKRSAANSQQISGIHDNAINATALDQMLQARSALAANLGISPSKAMERLLKANPAIYENYIREREEAMDTRKGRQAYLTYLRQRMGGQIVHSQNLGDAARPA